MTGNFPKPNNLLARSYPFPIGRVRKSLHLRVWRLQSPGDSLSARELSLSQGITLRHELQSMLSLLTLESGFPFNNLTLPTNRL